MGRKIIDGIVSFGVFVGGATRFAGLAIVDDERERERLHCLDLCVISLVKAMGKQTQKTDSTIVETLVEIWDLRPSEASSRLQFAREVQIPLKAFEDYVLSEKGLDGDKYERLANKVAGNLEDAYEDNDPSLSKLKPSDLYERYYPTSWA